MPLFFFHVRGDVPRTDRAGINLKDAEEAWAEALTLAKDLQAEPDGVFDGCRWAIEVNDEAGEFLFRLDFDQTD